MTKLFCDVRLLRRIALRCKDVLSSTGFSLCSVDEPPIKPHRLKRLRKKLFISVPQAPEPAIFSNSRDLPLGSGVAPFAFLAVRLPARDLASPSGRAGHQLHQANQVRGRRSQTKPPIHSPPPAQFRLPKSRHRLQPTKILLNHLPLRLTGRKSRMLPLARTQTVRPLRQVLLVFSNVRNHSPRSQPLNQFLLLIALVRSQREFLSCPLPLLRPHLLHDRSHHRQGCQRFFARPRLRHTRLHNQPIPVFHHQVSQITGSRFSRRAPLVQPRFRIRPAFVRVSQCLPPSAPRPSLRRLLLLLKTLPTRPGLDERPIHREVLIRQQPLLLRLSQHRLEKLLRNLSLQQPLPVFREHRHVPHLFVHTPSHKPAVQQVVAQLFHQPPLTAHTEQHLQQQRAQQLLRRNRRPSVPRIHLAEFRGEVSQCTVGHLSHAPQRMIQGNSLLEGNVTEHALLLFVVSAHTRWMLRPRSRCEITDFFRSLFSLWVVPKRRKSRPHRLKPVLLGQRRVQICRIRTCQTFFVVTCAPVLTSSRDSAWPRPNVRCSALTAFSMPLASTRKEMLYSEEPCAMAIILIPSLPSVLKTRAAMSGTPMMPGPATVISATSRVAVTAFTHCAEGRAVCVILVPGLCGSKLLRIHTGMPLSITGCSVIGWSTFAPKNANSPAS